METKILIMRPDEPHETQTVELPRKPTYAQLKAVIEPLLNGAPMEHVSVLADFKGGLDFKPADMFVDEMAHVRKGVPPVMNGAATVIYRRASILRSPGIDPDSLPWIGGTALLFHRRVWS